MYSRGQPCATKYFPILRCLTEDDTDRPHLSPAPAVTENDEITVPYPAKGLHRPFLQITPNRNDVVSDEVVCVVATHRAAGDLPDNCLSQPAHDAGV